MTTTPIKKVIPKHGTYRPYRPKPQQGVDRHIIDILTSDLEAEFLELRDAIADLEVIKVAANKTGRRVHVRAKVLGRSVKLSLYPYEITSRRTARTVGSVLGEVTDLLARRLLEGGETGLTGKPMVRMLCDAVASRLGPGEYCGHAVAITAICREMADEFAHAGPCGPEHLHKALTEFVSSGGISSNFSSHQKTRAIGNFREMACHAFRNGASLEEMVQALEEEMIRAVQES